MAASNLVVQALQFVKIQVFRIQPTFSCRFLARSDACLLVRVKRILSNGTVVHLGGNIGGTSALSEKLRHDAPAARESQPCMVISPPAPGSERLRLGDPWHMRCWVRDETDRAGVGVLEEPEVRAPGSATRPQPLSMDSNFPYAMPTTQAPAFLRLAPPG
jgi:hypothetical protein